MKKDEPYSDWSNVDVYGRDCQAIQSTLYLGGVHKFVSVPKTVFLERLIKFLREEKPKGTGNEKIRKILKRIRRQY